MTKGVPGLLSALAIAVLIAAFPAVAADPSKVLHVAFVAPENGFDPQATGDLYSNYVNRQIFDSLYRYDYLARPYKVIPNTAAGLPEIRVIRLDQAQVATQPIPPNVFGYDPSFKGNPTHDVAGAKALLDKFGYVDRDGDGWRDLPDGKPLKLVLASDPSAIYRQFDELWKRSMDAIGIRIEFTKQKFPDTLKQAIAGQLQMWALGNTATNTSGGTFVDLLYGPHKGMTNLSRFDLPEFNALFEKAERMRDSPERTQLYRRMSQLVVAYAPWVLHAYRIENIVVHPWVRGYKYNTFDPHAWMYYDVDVDRRKAATK